MTLDCTIKTLVIVNKINNKQYIYIFVIMGQEESVANGDYRQESRNRYKGIGKKKINAEERFEHEGILKIRELPFRNSIQISSSPPLFIENTNTSLYDLLEQRYNTNRLFIEEDIIKLLQTILYTLTFLETKNVVYGDLSTQNIFYDSDSGSFKLLPMELIKETAYQLAFARKKFSYLSPELIIALRYREKNVEFDILSKSNIFSLGMILLQVTSLQSSKQCYQEETYDILDSVINERLQTIREFYPEKIVKFIALMLDYDYTERMSLKALSVQVNRQLMEQKMETQKMTNSHIFPQRNLAKSRIPQPEQRKKVISPFPQNRNSYTPVITQHQLPQTQHYEIVKYEQDGQQEVAHPPEYGQQQNQNQGEQNENYEESGYAPEIHTKSYFPQHEEIYYQKPNQQTTQNISSFSPHYNIPQQFINQQKSIVEKGVPKFKQTFQQQPQSYLQQSYEKSSHPQYQQIPPFVFQQPQISQQQLPQQLLPQQQQQRFPSNQPYHFQKKNQNLPVTSNQSQLINNQIQNYTLASRKKNDGSSFTSYNNQKTVQPQNRSPFKPTNLPEKEERYTYYSPYKEQQSQEDQQNNKIQRFQKNPPNEFREPDISDSSISKIKQEIERSRKLIMEFQRSQGIMQGKHIKR